MGPDTISGWSRLPVHESQSSIRLGMATRAVNSHGRRTDGSWRCCRVTSPEYDSLTSRGYCTNGQVQRGTWSWRQVDLSSERDLRQGHDLRFVGPLDVELTMCSYDLRQTQRTHTRSCTSEEVQKRLRVPVPVKTG